MLPNALKCSPYLYCYRSRKEINFSLVLTHNIKAISRTKPKDTLKSALREKFNYGFEEKNTREHKVKERAIFIINYFKTSLSDGASEVNQIVLFNFRLRSADTRSNFSRLSWTLRNHFFKLRPRVFSSSSLCSRFKGQLDVIDDLVREVEVLSK